MEFFIQYLNLTVSINIDNNHPLILTRLALKQIEPFSIDNCLQKDLFIRFCFPIPVTPELHFKFINAYLWGNPLEWKLQLYLKNISS